MNNFIKQNKLTLFLGVACVGIIGVFLFFAFQKDGDDVIESRKSTSHQITQAPVSNSLYHNDLLGYSITIPVGFETTDQARTVILKNKSEEITISGSGTNFTNISDHVDAFITRNNHDNVTQRETLTLGDNEVETTLFEGKRIYFVYNNYSVLAISSTDQQSTIIKEILASLTFDK